MSLTIPESVTSIEMEAFRECDVLESINVGKNVTNIHPQAFKFCSKLKNKFNVEASKGKGWNLPKKTEKKRKPAASSQSTQTTLFG